MSVSEDSFLWAFVLTRIFSPRFPVYCVADDKKRHEEEVFYVKKSLGSISITHHTDREQSDKSNCVVQQ